MINQYLNKFQLHWANSVYSTIILIGIVILIFLLIRYEIQAYRLASLIYFTTIIIVELHAGYVNYKLYQINLHIYNPWILIDAIFLLGISSFLRNIDTKWGCLLALIELMAFFADFAMHSFEKDFFSLQYCVICIINVFLGIKFFIGIFVNPVIKHLYKETSFFFHSAIFFYYIASMPLFSLINFFQKPPEFLLFNWLWLMEMLNSIFYLTIIASFFTSLNKRKGISTEKLVKQKVNTFSFIEPDEKL